RNSESVRVGIASISGNANPNLKRLAHYHDLNIEQPTPLPLEVSGVMTIKKDQGTDNASFFRNNVKENTSLIPTVCAFTVSNLITIGGVNRTNSVNSPNPEANKYSNQEIRQAGGHSGLTET